MWIAVDAEQWPTIAKQLQSLEEPLRSYVRDVLNAHVVQQIATQYAAHNLGQQVVVRGVHVSDGSVVAFVSDRFLSEHAWLMQLNYDSKGNDWFVSYDRLVISNWTATEASNAQRVSVEDAAKCLAERPARRKTSRRRS